LLRNVDIRQGLCNGTRLVFTDLRENIVCCLPLTGPASTRKIGLYLSRFRYLSIYFFNLVINRFQHHDDKQNLHFRRLQFPVIAAYALSINKAQGQTADRVGIYLKSDVFAPGQLYVALSRVKDRKGIRIFAPNAQKIGNFRLIKNIVAPGLHRH
jgi:ATP-dependent DNA helicase PIF1